MPDQVKLPSLQVCTRWALLAGAVALLALGLLLWLQDGSAAESRNVAFGQAHLTVETKQGVHVFHVEVAGTPEQWARGLMFRTELARDGGMLFLFPRERRVRMWMKNTLVPLDMIFITRSGQVAEVVANTRPQSLEVIAPQTPVPTVLELRAGIAARLGIRPGDSVRWEVKKSEW